MIAAAAALGLALLALPGPALALDDGGGQWVPGSVLIKFGTSNRNLIDGFVRQSMGGTVIRHLPLIPHAYELRVNGDVMTAINHGLTVSHDEGAGGPMIEWAQPNYVVHLKYFATPEDKAYYPNDPRFWPYAASNPNSCSGSQSAQGQAALWPWYGDLANSLGPWGTAKANPLSASQRLPDTAQYDVGLSGSASSSIDVLPVWNALADSLPGDKPTTGPTGVADGKPVWRDADLRRSGIAVWDSGLSNAPDLEAQVAALISVGTNVNSDTPTELWRYVYADNPQRLAAEMQTLKAELRHVTTVDRHQLALLPIDDLGSGAPGSALHLPTGCDGHGTEVASVAAATADNGQGIAGVGWNVPVVGIRQAVPVLDTTQDLDAYRDPGKLLAAVEKQRRYELSDADMIDALTIVQALKLPVLNMSWGSQLFYSEKVHGDNEVVVQSPAVVEAMGRVLTDGVTLGVAAAGPGQYGVGQSARGAVTERGEANAAQFPCALRALGKYHVKVLTIGLHPFDSGVNWSDASLLCVTGTYTDRPELIPHAGSGDAAVDLAAPGVATVATRPLPGAQVDRPTATYRLAYGTSFAAAMVSGAAALLRELAPTAKPQFIAQALRAGARPDLQLARTVRYGWLDVACSALWLAQRADTHPDWGVRVPVQALELPETAHCFKSSTAIYQYNWTLPKSYFDEGSLTSGADGFSRGDFSRGLVASRLVQEAFADKNDIVKARGIQNVVLGPESTWNPDQIAFFPIQPGLLLQHPRAPTRQFVYNFQGYNVGCPAGSRLTGFSLKWKDLLHPQGYIWFSPKAAVNRQIFMVALIKPWYEFLLPKEMRIEVTARCIRPPADSEP